MLKLIRRFLFVKSMVVLLFAIITLALGGYSFKDLVIGLNNYFIYTAIAFIIVLGLHFLREVSAYVKNPKKVALSVENKEKKTTKSFKVQFNLIYAASVISALFVVFSDLSLTKAVNIIVWVDAVFLTLGTLGTIAGVWGRIRAKRRLQQ